MIVIRSLVPGGVAQVDGNLVPGDRLVFVNDVNLENATLDEVCAEIMNVKAIFFVHHCVDVMNIREMKTLKILIPDTQKGQPT